MMHGANYFQLQERWQVLSGKQILSVTAVIIMMTRRGLYYLQSRYYDPTTGRFVNADGLVSTGQSLLGFNMYSYCLNNPVNMCDPTGTWSILNKFTNVLSKIPKIFNLGKGWSARIDTENIGVNKRHVHVYNNSKNYAQNDDGSPHDKHKNDGTPPKKVIKKLKEQTGWDWSEKETSFLNKSVYNNCGNVSRGYNTYSAVYQIIYDDETVRYSYENSFLEFSPSTDRLREIYEFGMSNNPIINSSSGSIVVGPMPFHGPINFPSIVPYPVPAF